MEQIEWSDGFANDSKETANQLWNTYVNETKDIKGIVVWIHAQWCGPCRRLEKEVKETMNRNPQWKWCDIMVPEDDFEKEELKEVWGFTTIPHICIRRKESKTWESMKWNAFKVYVS